MCICLVLYCVYTLSSIESLKKLLTLEESVMKLRKAASQEEVWYYKEKL